MTTHPGPSLYNQTLLNNDDFVANFVARHDVLDALIRRLKAVSQDDSGLHHVLIGPRGMGKTSLLRRLAIAIERDPDLARRYIPLGFREEQYNVLTLGDFWRNCGESLAEWAEATGRTDLAASLDTAMASKAWAGETAPAEAFRAELTKLDRRAVLLLDNIDLILDAFCAERQWRFRRSLQERMGPVVVGAATHALRQAADPKAAFYEFFQPHYLEPLDELETERCIRALASRRGALGQQVTRILDTQPERLKTLHTLTGGNPRILTLIYRLLESEESEQTMADLERLLDQVTPYYKARIEEYHTPQQRAVIDAIALHWDPIATRALSQATGIVTTTLSPLLIKLQKDGFLDRVETSGSYPGYQLAERFLNIWYLMRHGTRRTKQRMRWLVGFLSSFYSPRELAAIAKASKDKLWHKDYEMAFSEALSLSLRGDPTVTDPLAEHDQRLVDSDTGLERLNSLHEELRGAIKAKDHAQCLDLSNQILSLAGDEENSTEPRLIANVLFNRAVAQCAVGDTTGALAGFEALTNYSGGLTPSEKDRLNARALLNTGLTLAKLDDQSAEIAAYNAILDRFSDSNKPEIQEVVAAALYYKGSVFGLQAEFDGSVATYDRLLDKFGGSEIPVVKKHVARALLNKGVLLSRAGRHDEALETYDTLIDRFAGADNVELRRQAAMAMNNKGVLATRNKDWAAAREAFDAVLQRYGDSPETSLSEQVAKALVSKGLTMARLQDRPSAVRDYDLVIARYGDAPEAPLQVQVARALFLKAHCLGENGDSAGEITIYDEIVARFADADEPRLRHRVAQSLVNKASALGREGHLDAAVITCDEVLTRFGDDDTGQIREQVALALLEKGLALADPDDSERAFNDLLARFEQLDDPAIRDTVALGLANKSDLLRERGEFANALSALDEAEARLRLSNDESIQEITAAVQVTLANLLCDLELAPERAERLYQDASRHEPILSNVNLAWLYLANGRLEEAEALRSTLEAMPVYGRELLDAGLALAHDNFGKALDHLSVVFLGDADQGGMNYSDDHNRVLRLAARMDYAERLLTWFEDKQIADRLAPLYVAFRAYVRGERTLLDANLEVRRPAQRIYAQLDAPRRAASTKSPSPGMRSRRRTKP